MRLTSIKLSGFKSFAEPTQLQLPGQLVGVVGPNGCGKSNIMDAVRWVLGESRASELRGESMQDVIFNGTTSRKPASRASVELAFDNASHRAGGQWNQFAEIAVKRVLTRDGGSSYYINNQPVRRRDVHDVFLGTGLGPRAYAIIGQGTISRIIESRPEELRLFLEEAAGVSKYKERRRETENRLADTRENLTRVQDILRELSGNLSKLEKQAEVAERYHRLQAQAQLAQQQSWFFKRQSAAQELEQVRTLGLQAVNDLESRMADLRRVQAELEAVRQAHYAAGDAVNQAQGKVYEATAEVGRLEAEIRYVVQGRERVQQRLVQLATQIEEWSTRQSDARTELESLAAGGDDAQEQAELLAAQAEEQAGELPELEDALHQARAKSEAQRQQVAQVQQQIQVLAAEQRSMQEQQRQHESRLQRLRADQGALSLPDETRLAQLQTSSSAAAELAEEMQARLEQLQQELPERDEARRVCQQTVNDESARHAQLTARLGALKDLQERLKTDGKLAPWLAEQGLDGLQGLWTHLRMEPGWESALEAALRERLGALPVGQLERVRGFASAGGTPPARLSFYSRTDAPAAPPGSGRLVDLVRTDDAALHAVLADWLHGCHTAASLDEALARRGQLQPGEVIYTREGHAVTAHAVDFHAPDSEQAGLLARAQEIEHLEKELRAQSLMAEEARSALLRAESSYQQANAQLLTTRREAAEAQTQAHAEQVELLRLTQAVEQARERGRQLESDLQEVQARLEELQERAATAEGRFEELDMQLADSQEREAQLQDQVIAAEQQLTQWREQQRQLERRAQEAQFAQRSLQARRGELERAVSMAEQQSQALAQESERAREELARLSDAAAQGGLQQALQTKLEFEQALASQRSDYDALTARLRASDELRMQTERQLEPQRARITELQLQEQAARLALQQYETLLTEADADLAALELSIAQGGVQPEGLQAQIEQWQRAIEQLGPVNLAALQELELARERHGFLQAQDEDLQLAMSTLEDAIRRIDAETRTLLSGTFETVNQHFSTMFPELFGGGRAQLIMTGDEILDAGVQVMAQPPGKKNQTIHLLSGGEKALTAIALVFAIFQLNPAPFCLLDEVDAPLDDANTERYAKLVASMSRGTQFLFISHNKIAMEMAEQLIGVTMQEQGVSRIVAVDMANALTMAQA
ncbi:chromosome segregation protein SMC [Comamonas flocculans]|uniref:Chromosome partition protein Smc n=1 Tax=Comamonas flocculans TaxID=2597701 RepID=A0A5B8RZI1_9BURK|nr:chromosome segregation protein SMC [Comamonas flocculans]QEA14152.1 chromosome segregation protein SMC [Comamonas flocculans]